MKGVSTTVFFMGPTSYQEAPTFEGAYLVGTIIGFSALGIFLLIAMFLIIRDEFRRHENYEKLI